MVDDGREMVAAIGEGEGEDDGEGGDTATCPEFDTGETDEKGKVFWARGADGITAAFGRAWICPG